MSFWAEEGYSDFNRNAEQPREREKRPAKRQNTPEDGSLQRQSALWTVLSTPAALSTIFYAMIALDHREMALLRRLAMVCKDFHGVFEPILYSAIHVTSNAMFDKLIHALSPPKRSGLRFAALTSLRIDDSLDFKNINRLLYLTSARLTNLQLCLLEAPTDTSKLTIALSKCEQIERFSLRGPAIPADKLAKLVALWPRLRFLDLEAFLPASFPSLDITSNLLPRLSEVVLHNPKGDLDAFLKSFSRYLEHLTLFVHPGAEVEFRVDDYTFKRLKVLDLDAKGGIDAMTLMSILMRGRAPALKVLAVVDLDEWSEGAMVEAACKVKGIEVVNC